jgi:hypothetical protein
VQLRQAVRHIVEVAVVTGGEVGARMLLAVPGREPVGAEPERSRQVDDRGPGVVESGAELERDPVGGGEHDDVERSELVEVDRVEGPLPGQVREQRRDRGAGLRVGGDDRRLERRVRCDQPQQLRAAVAGGADDPEPVGHGSGPSWGGAEPRVCDSLHFHAATRKLGGR